MLGVTDAHLQFWWMASGLGSSDSVEVEVNDGTGWYQVLLVNNDSSYSFADIDLSGYNMASNFLVRVTVYGNSVWGWENFYIDDLEIIGFR